MNTFVRNITFILILSFGKCLNAQQLPSYTQYINNGFLINPAVAGSDGYTSFNTTYRKQWIGFETSPTTYSFSGQTRLLKHSYRIVNRNVRKNSVKPSTKGRVGLGAYAFNDINGLVNRTGVSMAYAYHIYLYQSQISFGISGQVYQYKIDQTKLEFGSENTDPVKTGGLDLVTFVPDASAGFYWTSEKHFLGFSANQLFQSVLKIGSSDIGQLKLYRHYYLMGGYKFPVNREIDIEPSLLFKTTEQLLPQADISVRMFYMNDYWAGLSYRASLSNRMSGSISTMAGVRADKLYIGLAYDYSLSSIRNHSLGSVEVVVALKLGSNARRYRWINRY